MSKGNDSTLSIARAVQLTIEKQGIESDQARSITHQIMEEIRAEFGGGDLYISKHDLQLRDKAIRAEFHGGNREDICKKHGISKTTLYRIVGDKK